MQKIRPCLWFDTEGEEAAEFYTSVFPNSRILERLPLRRGRAARGGTAMTVSFELDGQEFLALNGGPQYTFTEAISFQVMLRDPGRGRCVLGRAHRGRRGGAVRLAEGPLRALVADRPDAPAELLGDPDRERAQRVMAAMLKMRKIEIPELEAAAAGRGLRTSSRGRAGRPRLPFSSG